jgi:crotonobetainyl-CoA:carnitine CoA-transferase CaiB-like acyl-CoA transferase
MAVAQRFWPEFCQVMGLAEVEHDSRFTTDDKRAANRTELIALLDRSFAARPRDHWERLFRQKEFWFSVVNRVSDLPTDPQVVSNEYLVELDNGLKTVSSPFQLEKTPAPLKKGAPQFSQHTDEILQEVCGYTMDEILAFKAEGVAW